MAYVISDACISCGSCADACPVGAISQGDDHYVINAGHLPGLRFLRGYLPHERDLPGLSKTEKTAPVFRRCFFCAQTERG